MPGQDPSAPDRQIVEGMRPLGMGDIPALLALARETIPDTMAARLGPTFAHRYHRALLDEPQLHLDGYFRGDELLGFIVYTSDVRTALRDAFRRNRWTFALALVRAVALPSRLKFVLKIGGSILGRLPEPGMDVKAELLTIAVRREARGEGSMRRAGGANVPHALMQRALTFLRTCDVTRVKVFCKPDDPAANGFVRKEGFELRGRVVRWGVDTNLYVRSLDDAARGSAAVSVGASSDPRAS